MARYDYGRGYRGPDHFTRWYPGAFWAGVPMHGWGALGDPGVWGRAPYAPTGYDGFGGSFVPPRRRPEQSAAYGRAGDQAARRYARSHGYDEGYAIAPHPRPRPQRGGWDRPRYDRGFGRGR